MRRGSIFLAFAPGRIAAYPHSASGWGRCCRNVGQSRYRRMELTDFGVVAALWLRRSLGRARARGSKEAGL